MIDNELFFFQIIQNMFWNIFLDSIENLWKIEATKDLLYKISSKNLGQASVFLLKSGSINSCYLFIS